MFSTNTVAELRKASTDQGVDADDFEKFLEYFALVYTNGGNYLSFGDSKILPACDKATFEKIVRGAPNEGHAIGAMLTADLVNKVFSLEAKEKTLTYDCTAYYGPDVSEKEVAAVDRWMNSTRMEAWNTRIFKRADGTLELRVAAATAKEEPAVDFEGYKIVVLYGDYQENMRRVVDSLKQARPVVENEAQGAMVDAYIKHFEGGNIEDHRESQKAWVRDKGPVVETNIGFIENYRDPAGVRAEWEGFVAVVNKLQSEKYEQMVQQAPDFITQLPWGKDLEKDAFTKPDFTSLEVLSFATSGIPIGICIPNYDDIRQDYGFKNVYLANVVGAMSFKEKLNHVTDADWELWKSHIQVAFPVGVGIHELLGHGTGKLFYQKEDGSFNYDNKAVKNPLTGDVVSSFYKPGETWSSVFKAISNPYEECRAEAVALYLCLDQKMLTIFGQTTEEDQFKTIHLIWLQMVRAGMVGLEFYSPEKQQWLQAHMRARYCILQTLLRQANPIVTIKHEGDNLEITIDANRIKTDGKAAIGDLLLHLQAYKSTADAVAGTKYFEDLTSVDDKALAMRATVMKVRKPRRQIVQPHTRLTTDGKDVQLVEFAPSVEGVVDSFVTRHKDIPI